jgi:PEP-CTERM motif
MLTRFLGRALLLVSLTFAAGSALADDVDYDFVLNWQTGPLTGTTSIGSFAFDSSLAVPNAVYLGTASLTAFSLSVGSTVYDLADVSIGYLFFDANADLRLLGLGTDCSPGSCGLLPHDPPNFFLGYDPQSQLDKFFAVISPADAEQSYATGTLQLAAPIPEPSTMALLLAGGGLLAWRRRKVRRAGVTAG